MSMDEYRNLSDTDKAYVSTYGWDLYRKKRAREMAEESKVEETEPEPEEELEEEEPEPEDDSLEAQRKDEIHNRKLSILGNIEKRLAKMDAEDEVQPFVKDYLFAIYLLSVGKVASFVLEGKAKGKNFVRSYKFYDKDGKEILFENYNEVLKAE